MRALALILAVLGFYGLFYRHVVGRLGTLAERIVSRANVSTRHSQRDVNDTLKLAAAGLGQLVFAVSLWFIAGIPAATVTSGLTPGILAIAALLGLSELGAAATLGRTVTMIATRADRSEARWLAEGQGGWMRQFRAAARIAPVTGAPVMVVLYVTGEEIVFRVVAVHLLSVLGGAWAIAISAALFVVVQVFGMPNVRAAIFPMVGSVVVGVTHAWLFLQVPALAPLVVAHSVFLLGALTQARGARLPVPA